ncbi:translesion DNA synthesis-associated protein ImuA [Pleionea sediminis]|uniref:translesion DNA synthesis-associated protein ImuA n=1 Tax=Pleionea sediminis TaxID=2569479 RepID=UPI001186F703|nr:translesion DNA synthesis-associated protein ImuA [Pleionea sediminis]
MSEKSSINQILKNPSVWQASRSERSRPVIETGFSKLDALLHDGGWPQGALTELLLETHGVGELRLLAPLLKRLSQESGFLVLVDPPFTPYGPALAMMGIDISKLFVVQTCRVNRKVWAAYQALTSRACATVLVWFDGKAPYKNEIRKLSLGAREGQCWGIIFRQVDASEHPSSARLRMTLFAEKSGRCHLTILKQAGGWSGQQLTLDLMPESSGWTSIQGKDWPVYSPILKQNRSVAFRGINSDKVASFDEAVTNTQRNKSRRPLITH